MLFVILNCRFVDNDQFGTNIPQKKRQKDARDWDKKKAGRRGYGGPLSAPLRGVKIKKEMRRPP
ncbi:hypothetical protein, partial [Natronogracilivirga saccharolytica]